MGQSIEIRKRKLVESALVLLAEDPSTTEATSRFAVALFREGAAEDVVTYTPAELAGVALEAYERMAERRSGEAFVRVYNPKPLSADGVLADVSVVEIVNDNMPFLVDSVMAELQNSGVELRLVLHPVLWVERDANGHLVDVFGHERPVGNDAAIRESLILFHVEQMDSVSDRDTLEGSIQAVLSDVRVAVRDWKAMRARVEEVVMGYKKNPPSLPVDELAEGIQFIDWVLDDNFTFLGMRDYRFVDDGEGGALERTDQVGLGLLANPDMMVLRKGATFVTHTPELLDFLRRPEPLIVTKANVRSRVHRRTYMDYVGLKTYDADGKLFGELRIVGLFSATAYTRSTKNIPYLRRKTDQVMERAGYDPDSHSGRALANVLESYPRDELFQLDLETLHRFAAAILQLGERPRVRVLSRIDKFDRFVSVLVFVPRERYSTSTRIKIGEWLAEQYQGRVSAWYVAYPEGPLARVHFILGRAEGVTPDIPQDVLEDGVGGIVRTWADTFRSAVRASQDPVRASLLLTRYADAFTGAYREAFTGDAALDDALAMEGLGEGRALQLAFRERSGTESRQVDLKLYHVGSPIALSDRMPIIEAMGFRGINERTYRVQRKDAEPVWMHDILLERADGEPIDLETLAEPLKAGFLAVWYSRAENDGFNALIAQANLAWRDVAMLRSLARYLRQALLSYSQDYVWATLIKHDAITTSLVDLFHARHDPRRTETERDQQAEKITAVIAMALDEVSSLDEDTILRRFLNLIQSILRTNFFQVGPDGGTQPTIAFKIDSKNVDGRPEPRPVREIFVYSPRVEGVHLRGGMIARGGLRWSDRPQDFRTEVLGLAKAQQVKNAVIVPFGAKGGFVPKQLPPRDNREAWFAEGTEAYKIFISSLLQVTDNLSLEGVEPPDGVVRLDGDDPYLVVAADKGTATFSDTANAISEAHGFGMGDAFASGGSQGYDHKKMGITARGGWEAVKRHFRERDTDIQTEPFTVVGVGDMSGDVFGNGMLLSPAIKLVAAFDHRDIFIDPDPDPKTSFAERQRLFDLGRSSWQDYDTSLLSAGGGIYPRSAKSIKLSSEALTVLGLEQATVTPNELMTAILKAQADLLWFGGIGTYIKATSESHLDAGDRANDAIRIDATELRVNAIGEGANLGITQRARIEAGLHGVRLNTDAIDNSAGVNSSDLEVNIKIALGAAEAAGKLEREERNTLLAAMTDEVAALVLRNNYLQTLSLSLTEAKGEVDFGYQARLMDTLEGTGLLDRPVEFLPDTLGMQERRDAGQMLTRPELAVLLAYAKIDLFSSLLDTDVPDDPYLGRELYRYFPAPMHEPYREEIEGHRLRREIIATQLANSMINRGGATVIQIVSDTTGASKADIACAFAIVRDAYQLTALNEQIDALDAQIGGALQLELYGSIQRLVIDRIGWFLTNVDFSAGLAGVVEHYREGIAAFEPVLPATMAQPVAERIARETAEYVEQGVPEALAERIASMSVYAILPDVILVRDACGLDPETVARAYFTLGAIFGLGKLDAAARELQVSDYYDALALDWARQSLASARRRLTIEVLQTEGGVDAWRQEREDKVARASKAIWAIVDGDQLTVSMLAVAGGLLDDLV
ncbi:MAG: NAD-glutamate dehydrogenase [Devosiaceae bacterium]|nr:NAD-glutamate dehydrogenase [Devosiaceae bacterium MH13]